MVELSEFSNIRPYTDAEAVEALGKLADYPVVDIASRHFFPDQSPDFLKGLLPRSIDTADLMIVFLLLLMNKDDDGGLSPVLTLALYFLL